MNPTLQMHMKTAKRKKKVVLEPCPQDTELGREKTTTKPKKLNAFLTV